MNYFNIKFISIKILDSLVVMISACHSLLELIAEGQGSIPCQGESRLFAFCFSLINDDDYLMYCMYYRMHEGKLGWLVLSRILGDVGT